MKIGIITFHFVSNQGAVLQCYALQKYLEDRGHEVYVINYRPRYHTVRYAAIKNPFLYSRGFWRKFYSKGNVERMYLTLRSFVRCLYLNCKSTDRNVLQCFDSFRNKYLNLTREYTTLEELRQDPPLFEAYICGSDQLWNPELLDQKIDNAYFLKFGSPETLRISYAVSIGRKMPEKYLREIKFLCKEFTAVSLREYDKQVIDAIHKKVYICIDPTFLLTADDYSQIEEKIDITEPYIFVYGFETTDVMINAIIEATEKYKCRVINGSPGRVKYKGDAENIIEYGPGRFLSYIKNAECVVTNSFHATTFSIIYKKRFITVPHSTRSLRMTSLLKRFNLEACLYGDCKYDINAYIDYEKVTEKLDEWKAYSDNYLNHSLNVL